MECKSRIAPDENSNRTLRKSITTKFAPSKETEARAPSMPGTESDGLPTTTIPPSSTSLICPTMKKDVAASLSRLDDQKKLTDPLYFQVFKICKTSEELMFLLWATRYSIKKAVELAAKSHWQVQRPLQALLSALSEPEKSCTKQSVAQLPPEG